MEFTSIIFAIFYSVVFLLYWHISEKNRKYILLIANIVFYLSFGMQYAIILAAVILFSYLAAKALEDRKHRIFLFAAVGITCSSLIIFKYLGFGVQIVNVVLGMINARKTLSAINLIAPLGISYYTFQTISYLVDVYKRKIKAEKNFVTYAVYISFFPLILSGPIERAGNILPQLQKKREFDYQNAVLGLERILWGCFKKLVIADNLAVYVNAVGGDVYQYSGFAIVLANLGYTIQLYCDFSGYSDMAIGFAKMLNIELKENFKTPYFSHSIKEFWARWHISLSSWLRDYIYIPLGGSRCSKIRSMLNLLVTFLISGIWHGAGIKYLIWGIIHGVLQCTEKIIADIFKRNGKRSESVKTINVIKIAVNFMIINFTWLPFWLPTTSSFLYAISHMFDGLRDIGTYIQTGINAFQINSYMKITLLAAFVILFVHDYKAFKNEIYDRLIVKNNMHRYFVRIFMLMIILCCNCVAGSSFIYFQY